MAVTIEDVKKVYKGEISDDDLTFALETAQLIVSEQLTCSMSEERRDKITIYLAAHFAEPTSISGNDSPGPVRRSKLGEADESYAIPLVDGNSGYTSTRWGQMAIALDLCGVLINSGTRNKAEFEVY